MGLTMDQPPTSLWGAHLFVPANNAGFLNRLPLLPARHVILDLEYATRMKFKDEARHLCRFAVEHLRAFEPAPRVVIRVNVPAAFELLAQDLRAVLPARPEGIRVPSVNEPSELEQVASLLDRLEDELELPRGKVRLHPMIESPRGYRLAAAIAGASERTEALCLGGEDWAHNLGLTRTRAGGELDHVRAGVVAAAAEHRLPAIDSVFNWLDDAAALEEDCKRSLMHGFCARATINPRQLATIDRLYRPSPENLAWATKLLSQLTEKQVGGQRHYVVDGVLTDPLAVAQARHIAAWKASP